MSLYLREQLTEAQARLAFRPPVPIAAIEGATGLAFTYVDVVEAMDPPMDVEPQSPLGTDYFFGIVPGDTYGFPSPMPPTPRFLTVSAIFVRALTNTRSASPHPITPARLSPGTGVAHYFGWTANDSVMISVTSKLVGGEVESVVELIQQEPPLRLGAASAM